VPRSYSVAWRALPAVRSLKPRVVERSLVLKPALHVRAEPPNFVATSFVFAREEACLNPSVDSYAMTARDPDDLASAEYLIKHLSTREIERHLRGIDPVGKSAPMGLRVHGRDYIAAVCSRVRVRLHRDDCAIRRKKHLTIVGILPNYFALSRTRLHGDECDCSGCSDVGERDCPRPVDPG
jgi:hypothetical protein